MHIRGPFIQGAGVGIVGVLALSACGGEAGGDGEEQVELRYAFWGSDTRVQANEAMIEEFNEEHPHIQIDIEYADWDGYWDQLNTQIAADDAPDIIAMDAPYLRQYAEQGSLLDLSDVDLAEIPEELVDSGTVDGGYYGLAVGVNAVAVVANPRVFEEAGVDWPDDATWTWEDFEEAAQQISGSSEGVYGVSGPAEPQFFQAWLRQQGMFFNEEDGSLGFGAEDLQEYLEWVDGMRADGVFPPAEVIVEEQSVSQDQSLEATGGSGMAFAWTNLLRALTEAGGEELELLRLPSPTGSAEDAQQWYNTGMISASGQTEHPEEVVTFLDFLANSEESALIQGITANTAVLESVQEDLDPADAEATEFVLEVEDELGEPEPAPATGFGEAAAVLDRYQEEVFFERMSYEDAAEQAFTELEELIG